MELRHFKMFLRITHPKAVIQLSDEEIDKTGIDFKKYLKERFKGKEDKLKPIWDIDPIKAMIEIDSPLRSSGYHPALILHFGQFIKEELAKL